MKSQHAANAIKFCKYFLFRTPSPTFALMVVSLVTQTGCATHDLWSKSVFMPAYPARLRLSEAAQPADILVQYEEEHVGRAGSQTRAYFLLANVTNIVARQRPHFVGMSQSNSLKPIPIINPASTITNSPPSSGYFVLTTTNRLEFVIYRDGDCVGHFTMPVYESMSRPASRVLLTPFAVGLDAVTAGVVAAAAMGAGG